MPAGNGEADSAGTRQQRSAISLSLWAGGVGLAMTKGMVYMATGSVLVRASMFDSLGDVFSSLIMALTQWRVSDHRDMHRYPMGKGRFAPLGVLFFCAFMCSTMLSMALDSFQSLLRDDSQDATATTALRRLFEEQHQLRWAYAPFWAGRLGTHHVDKIIADYGSGDEDEGSIDTLSTALMGVCVVVKVLLYLYCRSVGRRHNSEIVAALAADHCNDTISNVMVIITMVAIGTCRGTALEGPWLAKADPAVSFLLSLWIVRGWILNAMEQFRILSDCRAEDADVQAINDAVQASLQGSTLQFQGSEVYHVGNGCRVQLKVRPGPGASGASQEMALLFDRVESAVTGCSSDVQQVDVHLRSEGMQSNESFAWVKEYSK